jgi:50S ribosomal protein L16 3-hydroxylase
MLDEWLSPITVSLFARDYLRKQPFASRSSARSAIPVFGWGTLDRLLTNDPAADLLVIARGKLVDLPTPNTLPDVRALLLEGVGLVIRRAEQIDPGLAKLAASFTQNIPGEVHIQLFVTPAGTHGFGWHYDDEDVFIVQTEGSKDYFFRDNTVERDHPLDAAPDFTQFGNEASAIGTARLLAGDWLYIPARWWHVAKCVEDSLSISLGISPEPSWLARIKRAENIDASLE